MLPVTAKGAVVTMTVTRYAIGTCACIHMFASTAGVEVYDVPFQLLYVYIYFVERAMPPCNNKRVPNINIYI